VKKTLGEKVYAALQSERQGAVSAWRRHSVSRDPDKIDVYTHIASIYALLLETAHEMEKLEKRVKRVEHALGLGSS
jgi:hypothetical protein